MERLTYRGKNGKGHIYSEYHGCNSAERKRAMVADRLAAYEDTGLEPEDIISGLELTEVYSAILLLKQYRALGTIADLTAITKARDDGRTVVLPCNIGDTVYIIAYCGEIRMYRDDDYKTGTGTVQCPFENSCDIEECDDNHIRIFETECVGFMLDDRERMLPVFDELSIGDGCVCWGENAFLHRAEAEEALKGKNDG